ncbi:hypothetical protein [Pengzhenrongella phosphoraccumulans]|uniref:hypothetical protein n=1 Tax=Pengzhenrongella phosphoraccumulans TaxID=3114394 RepID=UPI00388E96D7
MNDDRQLDDLLRADDLDAGCAAGFEVLHEYVESELAGGDPARELPGLAAHLLACPACREDYRGLRDAAERFGNAGPSAP